MWPTIYTNIAYTMSASGARRLQVFRMTAWVDSIECSTKGRLQQTLWSAAFCSVAFYSVSHRRCMNRSDGWRHRYRPIQSMDDSMRYQPDNQAIKYNYAALFTDA